MVTATKTTTIRRKKVEKKNNSPFPLLIKISIQGKKANLIPPVLSCIMHDKGYNMRLNPHTYTHIPLGKGDWISYISCWNNAITKKKKPIEKAKRISLPFCISRFPGFFKRIASPSSRFHVTRGTGFPVARHVKVASSLSCTAISADDSSLIISGGTRK